jgi:hypothetical protein
MPDAWECTLDVWGECTPVEVGDGREHDEVGDGEGEHDELGGGREHDEVEGGGLQDGPSRPWQKKGAWKNSRD